MKITTATIIVILSTLALAGCGDPCLPRPIGDTSVIAAEQCVPNDTEDEPGSTDGYSSDASTSDESDADASSGSTGECVLGDNPLPGEIWGPCDADGSCGEGSFCITTAAPPIGTVCAPACAGGCPASACGGECLADGLCVSTCEVNLDCPFAGMLCTSGTCTWSG